MPGAGGRERGGNFPKDCDSRDANIAGGGKYHDPVIYLPVIEPGPAQHYEVPEDKENE